jgi:hypothetical protein
MVDEHHEERQSPQEVDAVIAWGDRFHADAAAAGDGRTRIVLLR